MICFNCGYELISNGTHECKLCGMKLSLKCDACGSLNPPFAKFCFNCGARIGEENSEDPGKKLIPLSENRKSVAVMFADISGFTALSENMDPEEVREIINECFQYITKPVYELEGTIDKYIGDCIMILFGAKYHHSDDPKRAVMCAVKMMDLVREYSMERLSYKGISLELSVGINYGLVVTGEVGNYFDKDYTVMGDIVNTAQRLQANAGKGTILVSESVYKETADSVQYSEPKEIMVKNKEKTVKCFSPVGFKRDFANDDMLLIGRENELKILNSIYSDAKQPRYMKVIGEGGIGKTSFIKRFLSTLGDGPKKIWVNCSPEYQSRKNYIITSILFSIMKINPGDSSRMKRNTTAAYIDYLLKGYDEELIQKNFNFISLVMGLERDADFQNILNSMSYEDIEREITNQLLLFFEESCRRRSNIFIIDDIQWADASSINILKALSEALAGGNSFFIFTSLYEIEGLDMGNCDKIHTLKLERLNKDSINRLVCRVLNCSKADTTLLDTIARFTNGNPLYIKEFLRTAKRNEKFCIKNDTAYVDGRQIAAIPNTIESLILSNLSNLDDMTIKYLQAASVAGREFNLSWVRAVIDGDYDEPVVLNRLLQLDILSAKSVLVSAGKIDRTYEFNQEIVRNVIYDSILNKSKKELHKRIGEFIEQEYPRELDNYYGILCMHFENAGLNVKAAYYCLKTAQRYKNDFDLDNSLRYYNKYLELSSALPEKDDNSNIVHALMDMSYIYALISDYDNALAYLNKSLKNAVLKDDIYSIKIMIAEIYKEKGMYNDALSLLDEIHSTIMQHSSIYGKLLQLKCSILGITGDSDAVKLAERSEKILLKVKDFENLAETMNQVAALYLTRGDMDNALFYFNKAFKYAESTNNLKTLCRISTNLGISYYSSGMMSKAFEYFTRSLELSKRISNTRSFITASANLGIIYMDKGLFNKAESLLSEALEKSRQISLAHISCMVLTNLGDLMYEKGKYSDALSYYEKSLDIADSQHFPVEIGVNNTCRAKVFLKLGSYEQIPGLIEEACKIFRDADEISCISDCYRLMSVFELINNNVEGALKNCDDSISTARESKNDMRKLKALRLKGNILVQSGKIDDAIEFYDESISLAEQLESHYEAAKGYYRKYSALYKIKRSDEAKANLKRAIEAIKKVDKCRWTCIIEQSPEMV